MGRGYNGSPCAHLHCLVWYEHCCSIHRCLSFIAGFFFHKCSPHRNIPTSFSHLRPFCTLLHCLEFSLTPIWGCPHYARCLPRFFAATLPLEGSSSWYHLTSYLLSSYWFRHSLCMKIISIVLFCLTMIVKMACHCHKFGSSLVITPQSPRHVCFNSTWFDLLLLFKIWALVIRAMSCCVEPELFLILDFFLYYCRMWNALQLVFKTLCFWEAWAVTYIDNRI